MEKRNIIRNQKGFTLIEIISVLVILGVLTAVAAPKFVSLQADAASAAAMQAVAEGGARVNSAAAAYILQEGEVPTELTDLTTTLTSDARLSSPETSGDYTITYVQVTTGSGSDETNVARVEVTATLTSDTSVSASNEFPLPE